MHKKPTLDQLEKLLDQEDKPIRVLPDGSLKVGRKNKKILTMKKNLKGSY